MLPTHKGFARRWYARESCYDSRVTSEVTSSIRNWTAQREMKHRGVKKYVGECCFVTKMPKLSKLSIWWECCIF